MPASAACKPWCEKHEDIGENSCTALICLYTTDDEPTDDSSGSENKEMDPQIASLREQFHAPGGFPDQVDTVFLEVSQDLEEDEEPLLALKFWDSTKDQDSAQLQIDRGGLEHLYSELGEAIKIYR